MIENKWNLFFRFDGEWPTRILFITRFAVSMVTGEIRERILV
jgi:hypothetical protein